MINYRYHIVEELARGGMGEVYRVLDTLHNREIAMKILSSSPYHKIDDDSIRNEFSLLSSLSHPNLIRVFDLGTVASSSDEKHLMGRHFYTMEYLKGQDAARFFNRLPMGRQKIELLEKVFIQALGVLDFIHERGIIHFDIKPQNLFVLEDGGSDGVRIKLTDFGFSSKKIEAVDIPIRGTLEYTAPEIIEGLPFDYRTDLYSLGVTFYHLLEGHCPFEATSPVDLLKRVLFEDFPELRQLGGIPSILGQLIEVFCRKNPNQRCRSPEEIILRFASSPYEDAAKRAFHLEKPLAYVGRENELLTVKTSLDALARNETPESKVILVTGLRGMGRTEFLKVCARYARSHGLIILEAEKDQTKEPSWSSGLASRQLELELAVRGIQRSVKTVSKLSREEEVQNHADYFESASQALPFVLIIDDLDQIDPMFVEVIRQLAKNAGDGKMIILASMVADEKQEYRLGNESIQQIMLAELSEKDVSLLLADALGAGFAASGVGQRVYELYGGNPSILRDTCRKIAKQLSLDMLHAPLGKPGLLEALEGVLAMGSGDFVAQWFLKLGKEKQFFLELLSCFDVAPTTDMLQMVLPFQRMKWEQYLCWLEKAGYVQLLGENKRYRIRPLKLKEYIYENIQEDRPSLHRFIALALENIPTMEPWQDIKEIGRHHDLSGNAERARVFYERAADKAFQGEAFTEAMELYNKVIASMPGNLIEAHLAVMMKLAQAYYAGGAYTESCESYERALSLLPADDRLRAICHKMLGKIFLQLGEKLKALAQFHAALQYGMGDEDRFEIQQEVIALKIAEGNYEEAIQLSETQKEAAKGQPNRDLMALVETDLGIAQFYQGNFGESFQAFTSAFDIYKGNNNRIKTIDALTNLGNVLSATSDFRGALEKWKQALELCDGLGTHHQRARILNNLGIVHYKLREFDEAKSYYTSAKEIFRQFNSKNGVTMTLTNLGEVAFAEGAYGEALLFCAEALPLYQELQDAVGITQTLLALTQLELILGDVPKANHLLEQTEELITKHSLSRFAGLFKYLQGSTNAMCGRYQKAFESYHEAEQAFRCEGAFTGGSESGKQKFLETLLREASVHMMMDEEPLRAVNLLQRLLLEEEVRNLPLVCGEVYYHLGEIANKCPGLVEEKPLTYFRRGLEAIENEQISEISWKISYGLATEYRRRGNRKKARENFVKAKIIIEYFADKFSSPSLRNQYLGAEMRRQILETIVSTLHDWRNIHDNNQ